MPSDVEQCEKVRSENLPSGAVCATVQTFRPGGINLMSVKMPEKGDLAERQAVWLPCDICVKVL